VTDSTALANDLWAHLETSLDAFVRAWQQGAAPPRLDEFGRECRADVRRQLLVELIKVDLEQRWQRGMRRLIEDYRDEVPDLEQHLTGQLIFEEFHARRQAGDEVTPEEYFRRFPAFAVELRQLFQMDPDLCTTAHFDGTTPSVVLNPGDRIDDFDLLIRLGQGAFATVFLARQRSLQRLVAVKVSADHGTEPQTLAQLDHNNIVRVYDQRSLPEPQIRLLYMQYAAGGTLADVIEEFGRVDPSTWSGRLYLKSIDAVLDRRGESPPADSATRRRVSNLEWPLVVAWIGSQLARALEAAHRKGVLHRDLKPANVLLTAEGVPKLADFNISFSSRVEGSSPAAYFGGSLAYMSPEQLEACNPGHPRGPETLDGRSDQYSLGVLLWELLTGSRPFVDSFQYSGWQTRLTAMVATRMAPRASAALTRVPQDHAPGLERVLQQCLSPDIENRYPEAAEVARELELCQQPEVRRLISGCETGWRAKVRIYPLITVVLITLVPNLVAAVFNFLYNHGEILRRLPGAESTFLRTQAIINLVAFPTGIACAGWLAGSVARAVRPAQSGWRQDPTVSLEVQRRACLDLGNRAAIISLTLWLIAAPAYPLVLNFLLGEVPIAVYAHFVASLALCGLIAAAYPFFGVTAVATRCFYPRLLQWDGPLDRDIQGLQRLSRQCWLYLGLAASVPMMAVAILVLSGADRQFELVALATGGVLGFGLALTAFRIVQSDLALLIRALTRD